MSKIQDLLKEKIVIRTSDPLRSSVLGMLIDNAKKAAKIQLREVMDEDIGPAARKMKIEDLKAIEEYKKGNGDYSQLEKEISILEEFIPQGLTEEQIAIEVKKVIDSLSSNEKVVKNIMPLLKSIPGMDMKIAKAYVDKLLA